MNKNKKFLLLLTILCFVITSMKLPVVFADEEVENKIYSTATLDNSFSESSVLVLLTKQASASLKVYTSADFNEIGCSSVYDLTSATTEKVQESLTLGEQPQEYNRILKLNLTNPSKTEVLNAINELIERDDVKYAGPDYFLNENTSSVPPLGDYEDEDQWGLIDIKATQCWPFSEGSPEILVGVVDTGIYADHVDLTNVVDRTLSRDFTQGLENPTIGDSLTDIDGHGTHIAGIISAQATNEQDVSGVCKNVKLVSLKIYDTIMNNCKSSNLISVIDYANQNEIEVLNLSLTYFDEAGSNLQIEKGLCIKEAITNYKGLLICAAGNCYFPNDGNGLDGYPASYDVDNIISVGATKVMGEIYTENALQDGTIPGSNYGSLVDVFAPGSSIYSTCKNPELYANKSGTSMATPFVAGTVAMLKSINPDLTNDQIKDSIIQGASNTSCYVRNEVGNDVLYQYKKLNTYSALKYVFNNYFDSLVLQDGANTYSKQINTNSSFYNENTLLLKLEQNEVCEFVFNISANSPCNVKLYNSGMNEISITSNAIGNNVEFTYEPAVGSCFLEVKYQNSSSPTNNNTIAINITHAQHDYTNRYRAYNQSTHKAICACNQYVIVPHVVLQENPNVCIDCLMPIGGGMGGLLMQSTGTQITENGSYISVNGIIMLNERDLQAYLNGTLKFFSQENHNLI